MPATDLNLLLGVTALQIDFITRDALIDAMQAWVRDKERSLVDILRAAGHLSERQAELLLNLAQEHIRRSGGTATAGLAALSSLDNVRPLFEAVDDADLLETLDEAHRQSLMQIDSDATAAMIPGGTTSPTQSSSQGKRSSPPSSPSRFKILRTHARGGLGQVYLAEDAELHRNVALKEILVKYADIAGNRERFLVEAEITGRLQHPGIVPVYGLGTYPDGRPFYAMRFIEGDNLLTAIRAFHHKSANQPWQGEALVAFRELLGRFMDVCDAMQFAHQRHVLHRDLKPHNIMLGEFGETLVVDWGLAKPLYEGRENDSVPESAIVPVSGTAIGSEREGSVLGTPEYMPPEQAAGNLSRLSVRSDIYSLGATLYHLLTNEPPFHIGRSGQNKSDSAATDNRSPQQMIKDLLQRVQAGEFLEPRRVQPKVPRTINAICMKAMATSPDARYESARELKQEIQRWLADEPVRAMPEAWYDRGGRWFRRHKVVTLVGGASLLALGIIASLAAVLITRARLGEIQQATINQLSMQLEVLIDRSVAEKLAMDQAFFSGQFDPLLARLADLAPDRAARSERLAIEAAANDISRRLTETTPTDDVLKSIAQQIDQWSERRADAVDSDALALRETELRELLKNRQAPWNTLPELSGPALLRTVAVQDDVQLDHTETIRDKSEIPKYRFRELTVSQLPANLNHELVARFHPDSFDGPAIAIGMSPQKEYPEVNQYQAVICVKDYSAGQWSARSMRKLSSLKESIESGLPTRLLICRGQTVLNETLIRPSLESFGLQIRREDNRLRAVFIPRIGPPTQIEYLDFLPLAHGNRPGVWIGPTTAIESLTLGYRARPAQETELEQIKNLIASGQNDSALSRLAKRTDRESLYLRSRCLIQPDERLGILDELLSQSPQINASGVVLDEWYLQALLDAIDLNDSNPERFRELVKKFTYFYTTSIEDVTARISQDTRERLLDEFRKLGGRWRVAIQPAGNTEMLNTAIRLDRALEPDAIARRATRWRRCDALRVIDQVDEAAGELRKLLDEALADPAAEAREAANLLSDLCWVYFARKRLVEAENLLDEMSRRPDLDDSVTSAITIESARLAIHKARFDEAAERIGKALANPVKLSRCQHTDACLVAGFIEIERGNPDAAQAFWQLGRTFEGTRPNLRSVDVRKVHGTQAVELQFMATLDGVLGSLTQGFDETEALTSFDAQIPERGVYGASGQAIVKSGFDPALIRDIANGTYQGPGGREVARSMAFRKYDIRDFFSEPVKLLIYEGVMLQCFEDLRDDTEFAADARTACDSLFRIYDNDGINEQEDMRLIVTLWSGEAGVETWETLSKKLPNDVAAGLALVAARAQMKASTKAATDRLKESHLYRARDFFKIAQEHPGSTASIRRLTQRFLTETQP